MYFEKIINGQTGEEIMRPFNEKETAEIEANKAIMEQELAEQEAKKAKRQSALNKLIDLGLTEDEIAAL